jgi:ketosteroid isomerase-like protein
MNNEKLIQNFYQAFADVKPEGMVRYYADNIEFKDPAFGLLKGDDAKNMWRMLLQNPDIKVTVSNIRADEQTGSADWVAFYTFSRTGRKVTNRVTATFEFKDGSIVKHTDHFDIWKWAGQALGLPGYLLGWAPFMQKKIRVQALSLLAKYQKQV